MRHHFHHPMIRFFTLFGFLQFLSSYHGIRLFSLFTNAQKCELLKTSLTYTQETAPRDLSDILPIIVEKVNRELEGVVDVEVLFTGGDMYDRVGNHNVNCSVTRLLSAVTLEKQQQSSSTSFSSTTLEYDKKHVDDLGRHVISQCFQIEFTILDVDECKLPIGHVMRHQCVTPSLCINTFGSYECLCPQIKDTTNQEDIPKVITADSVFWARIIQQKQQASSSFLWDVSLPSSSCPLTPTTHGCCDTNAHSIEGSTCRSLFACPIDPCSTSGINDCDLHATCKRSDNPMDKPNYICECIDGLMGNGHKCRTGIDPKPKPMVMFDGITPTFETTQHGLYCGCSKPIIDPCSGFPKCEGKD